jgi:hypothetical protein
MRMTSNKHYIAIGGDITVAVVDGEGVWTDNEFGFGVSKLTSFSN